MHEHAPSVLLPRLVREHLETGPIRLFRGAIATLLPDGAITVTDPGSPFCGTPRRVADVHALALAALRVGLVRHKIERQGRLARDIPPAWADENTLLWLMYEHLHNAGSWQLAGGVLTFDGFLTLRQDHAIVYQEDELDEILAFVYPLPEGA